MSAGPSERGGRWTPPRLGAQVLEFRLCRAIRLTWFLAQGGSVSHARSWTNREALPACDTYLTAQEALLAPMRMLAWPGSFLSGSRLPPAQCEPDATNECAKQQLSEDLECCRAMFRLGCRFKSRWLIGSKSETWIQGCPERPSPEESAAGATAARLGCDLRISKQERLLRASPGHGDSVSPRFVLPTPGCVLRLPAGPVVWRRGRSRRRAI